MASSKKIPSTLLSDEEDKHHVAGTLGAAVGAAAGVAAAGAIEGASFGSIAGLPGVVLGVAIGAAAGAYAGKEMAQTFNPTKEEEYWRDNHEHQDYFNSVVTYDSYAPAYRFGIEAYATYVGRKFAEIEPQLAKQWDDARGTSRLTWDTARLATRDAYERLYTRHNA